MSKKITSIVLALCMMISCVAIGSFTTSAASTSESVSASVDSGSTAANYGLASQVKDGNILHCFDWKYNDIKAELKNIAEAGFTTVQTSPVANSDPLGEWYGLYLPLAFKCEGNYLGSRSELQALCAEADNYGIKVICDVVANHLSGDHSKIQDDLKDGRYWHQEFDVSDWNNRYQVINGKIGMADLKTEDTYVQNVVFNYLQDLKSIGVDGFRFDAAKHIGLPSEGDQFWARMSQIGVFRYGEILDNPGGDANSIMNEYANYIGITDSDYSGAITGSIRDGNASVTSNGNWVNRGIAADKIVYWGESHDTFSNNPPPQEGGWTKYLDQNVIDRAYAVVGAKANSQSLYLSRPPFTNKTDIKAGQKGSTHFKDKQVAEVNHFHNAMIGQNEYFATGNNCYVVTRGGNGTGGVVIVAASGSNFSVTVPNGGGLVPSGSYTDAVSGNRFTVDGSNISGQIGSTGIAVIYNAKPAGPSVSADPGTSSYKTDTLNVTLSYSDATSGTYSIDGGSAQSFSGSKTVTIGQGAAYGTKTTIKVTATNGTETASETYTYTKVDPSLVQTVYFDNSSYNWSQVFCYMYVDGGAVSNGLWPGQKMNKGNSNIYQLDVEDALSNGVCIFTEYDNSTDHRYPAHEETGLPLGGKSMILRANHVWEEYSDTMPTQATQPATQATQPPTPVGKVLIGDVDQNGHVSIKDGTFIQMKLAEMITLSADAETAADINKDGVVTIKDVTSLQRYLAHYNDSDCYAGKYTDGSEPETHPQTQPTQGGDGNYVYFRNSNNWSGTIYAYMWNGDGGAGNENAAWPGVAMESVGNNVWRYEAPSYQNIIFNNNGGDATKTSDLSFPGTGYIYDGGWSVYGDNPQPQTQPTQGGDDSYVYFRNSNNWSGTIYAYMWNGDGGAGNENAAWPGVAMENIGNNVWRYEAPSYANIIFNNNGGDATKTSDLSFPGAGYIYDGGWSVYGDNPQPQTQPTQGSDQPGGSSVSLNPGICNVGDEVWYAWTWGSGEGKWVKGEGSGSNYVFNNVDSNIIFVRMNGDNANWDNVWNKTEDLTTQFGGTYTISGWGSDSLMNGSW